MYLPAGALCTGRGGGATAGRAGIGAGAAGTVAWFRTGWALGATGAAGFFLNILANMPGFCGGLRRSRVGEIDRLLKLLFENTMAAEIMIKMQIKGLFFK